MRKAHKTRLRAEELLLKQQQAAIGCVAVESARLEHLTTVLVWSVLSLEVEPGRVVTDNFSTVSSRLKLLNDLMPLLSGGQAATEFHRIYEDITQVFPRRNTVIHGKWEPTFRLSDLGQGVFKHRKGDAMAKQRAPKSKTARLENADDVMAIAHELHRCYRALYDLTQKYRLLPPSPEIIE